MTLFVTEYIEQDQRLSLNQYLEKGGFQGMQKALAKKPQEVINEIKESGLRGRGGAYFPTGIKWESFAASKKESGYIVCNGDEGEPGTFKDRYLLEHCCWQVLEGMIIAAYATETEKGYFYLRGEYEELQLEKALEQLRAEGLLGRDVLGTDFCFDIELRLGAGAYICGEESALLESLEGKRAFPRNKPPLPSAAGLWQAPTLINNVETLANIPQILRYGAAAFRRYGTAASPGTKLVCLSGAVKNRGVFEVPFGISLKELYWQTAGGPSEGETLGFVHLGGLTGCCLLPEEFESLEFDILSLRKAGFSPGTGAFYFAPLRIKAGDYLLNAFTFFQEECCGRCAPCREGIHQLSFELIRLLSGAEKQQAWRRIMNIADAMEGCSRCGMGQAAPRFLRSILRFVVKELGIEEF